MTNQSREIEPLDSRLITSVNNVFVVAHHKDYNPIKNPSCLMAFQSDKGRDGLDKIDLNFKGDGYVIYDPRVDRIPKEILKLLNLPKQERKKVLNGPLFSELKPTEYFVSYDVRSSPIENPDDLLVVRANDLQIQRKYRVMGLLGEKVASYRPKVLLKFSSDPAEPKRDFYARLLNVANGISQRMGVGVIRGLDYKRTDE
jgi:hypothetical protein